MSAPVFIAGIGAVSAIGNNVAEHLASFEQSEAGMGAMSLLKSVHSNQLPVAEVKISNKQLVRQLGLDQEVSRTAMLSMLAAKEALHSAAIPGFDKLRTGFISANTVGGMDRTEHFLKFFFPIPPGDD
jgi:3-oxoacyl-[acyl-carrier-protein] synthase-1